VTHPQKRHERKKARKNSTQQTPNALETTTTTTQSEEHRTITENAKEREARRTKDLLNRVVQSGGGSTKATGESVT
jgi:hypothetical protein